MTTDSQQIVAKAWKFAHVLRDDGLSYMAYTEQITFLPAQEIADDMQTAWEQFLSIAEGLKE